MRTESLEATGSVENLSLGLVPSSLLVRVTSGVEDVGLGPLCSQSAHQTASVCPVLDLGLQRVDLHLPADYSLRPTNTLVSTAHNLRSWVFQSSQ